MRWPWRAAPALTGASGRPASAAWWCSGGVVVAVVEVVLILFRRLSASRLLQHQRGGFAPECLLHRTSVRPLL